MTDNDQGGPPRGGEPAGDAGEDSSTEQTQYIPRQAGWSQQQPPPGQQPPPAPPQYGQPPAYGQQPPPAPPQYGQPPPQYGSEQYGQQPFAQPQPHRSTRTPLFVGLGVVVVAGVVVLILALTGVFSSDNANTGSPQAAVRGYLNAVVADDPNAAIAYVCAANKPALSSVAATYSKGNHSGGSSLKSYQIVDSSASASSSSSTSTSVKVKAVTASGTETDSLPVIKEGGKWLVCESQ